MRRLLLLVALGCGWLVPSSAAIAEFTCAHPTVAQSLTDEDKQAIFDINREIGAVKKMFGASYLGAQDGIMCNAPDGKGKFWHFQHGSVYWSPGTGAHAVLGPIRKAWADQGWEKGPLGYPMSDEIPTYDGLAKVSKFQGGQLIWRPWTSAVTQMSIEDLQVDLATPVGEAWRVVQANGYKLDDPATPTVNEGDSHGGPWVYCFDLGAVDGSKTPGAKFLSTADARVVMAVQSNANDNADHANLVVQWLGLGRYASSLHVQHNSYADTFGQGKPAATVTTPWSDRPTASSGDQIAKVGRTGTKGAHIHFCVTTAPDGESYPPFESVPFAFRNYQVATDDQGTKWKDVAVGRPERGAIIRRPSGNPGGVAKAKILAFKDLLNFGSLEGAITLPAGVSVTSGKIQLTPMTAWGEPLAGVTVNASGSGPFTFKIAEVPNYNAVTLHATFTGTTSPANVTLKGTSGTFGVQANKANTVNLTLTK